MVGRYGELASAARSYVHVHAGDVRVDVQVVEKFAVGPLAGRLVECAHQVAGSQLSDRQPATVRVDVVVGREADQIAAARSPVARAAHAVVVARLVLVTVAEFAFRVASFDLAILTLVAGRCTRALILTVEAEYALAVLARHRKA